MKLEGLEGRVVSVVLIYFLYPELEIVLDSYLILTYFWTEICIFIDIIIQTPNKGQQDRVVLLQC